MTPPPDAVTDVAWLALGSNLGHRGAALSRLRDALQDQGIRLEQLSMEVLTRPLGVRAQEDFHNQVARARSPAPWTGLRWLDACQAAERAAGRVATYRWGPRVADADILLLGPRGELHVDSERLAVPHPELEARPFLGELLAEAGFSGRG